MIKRLFIGIDPGVTGSMTIISISNDDTVSIDVFQFSKFTEQEISEILEKLSNLDVAIFCVIEKIGSIFGVGKHGYGVLMHNVGLWRGFLMANKIPFQEVTAKNWQKHYALKKNKSDTSTIWKNKLKGLAQQYYPKHKVTLAMADSMLIARYCQENFKPQMN